MSVPSLHALFATVLLLLCSLQAIRTSNRVSVRLKLGEVIGSVETPIDGIKLNVFRGIPYAKPPVGSLRFRKPLPVEPWSAPVEALQFSSSCAQNAKLFDVETYLLNKNISRRLSLPECLVTSRQSKAMTFLSRLWFGSTVVDFWWVELVKSTTKVIFWLRKEDVVVVSLNYRSVLLIICKIVFLRDMC